ncbi:hypothetical protein [Hydrogenimonas sp.]
MSTMLERAERRRKNWNIRILKLKDEEEIAHGLSVEESLELLHRLSQDAWYLQTGRKASGRVDKSVVAIRKLGDECI